MTVLQSDLAAILRRLHGEVRDTLADLPPGSAQEIHGTNAKGDRQRTFDLAVDTTVRRFLEEEFDGGIVLSEESTEHRFGIAVPAEEVIGNIADDGIRPC